MTVFEAVVLRLAMLGYKVIEDDTPGLEYQEIRRAGPHHR